MDSSCCLQNSSETTEVMCCIPDFTLTQQSQQHVSQLWRTHKEIDLNFHLTHVLSVLQTPAKLTHFSDMDFFLFFAPCSLKKDTASFKEEFNNKCDQRSLLRQIHSQLCILSPNSPIVELWLYEGNMWATEVRLTNRQQALQWILCQWQAIPPYRESVAMVTFITACRRKICIHLRRILFPDVQTMAVAHIHKTMFY